MAAERSVDFRIRLDMFARLFCPLFMIRHLKIGNLSYHFFDVIHGIVYGFFLCRIHNLLHAFFELFLQICRIEFLDGFLNNRDPNRSFLPGIHFFQAVPALPKRTVFIFLRF